MFAAGDEMASRGSNKIGMPGIGAGYCHPSAGIWWEKLHKFGAGIIWRQNISVGWIMQNYSIN